MARLAATGRWRMQAMTFGSSDLLARSEAERRRVAGSRRLSSALAAALRGRQLVDEQRRDMVRTLN